MDKFRIEMFFLILVSIMPHIGRAGELQYYMSNEDAKKACTTPSQSLDKDVFRYGCHPISETEGDMTYYAFAQDAQKACTTSSLILDNGAFRYGCPPNKAVEGDMTYYAFIQDARKACQSPSLLDYKGALRFGCPPISATEGDMTYYAFIKDAFKVCSSPSQPDYHGASRFGCKLKLTGNLRDFSGEVFIKTKNGALLPLKSHTRLTEGDQIVTGVDGQAKFQLDDGSKLNVRPYNEVMINKLKYDASICNNKESADNCSILVDLLKGSLRWGTGMIGVNNRNNVKFTTVNNAMGIRGTDFEMVYIPKNVVSEFKKPSGTYVKVNQGQVYLTNQAGIVDVSEGQFAYVQSQIIQPILIKQAPDIFEK